MPPSIPVQRQTGVVIRNRFVVVSLVPVSRGGNKYGSACFGSKRMASVNDPIADV